MTTDSARGSNFSDISAQESKSVLIKHKQEHADAFSAVTTNSVCCDISCCKYGYLNIL